MPSIQKDIYTFTEYILYRNGVYMQIETRQVKGYQIASKKEVKETKEGWLVKSQSSNKFYKVSEDLICDCPDSELHNETCKHAYAVRYYLNIEKDTPTGTQTERIKLTYGQAWSAYNKAQTTELILFDQLLKDLTYSIPHRDEVQVRGRPRIQARDQLFSAVKKVHSQMSGRRASSLFKMAQEKGQIDRAPHFNSYFKFMDSEKVTGWLQELVAITAAPLKEIETDFAVDSTGFRTNCFGAYCEGKYPSPREHKYLKLHACVGVKTNIITAAQITDENGNDSPQLIPLVSETASQGFKVAEVSADKAYSGRDNLSYVGALGATPYIPFKSNVTGQSGGSLMWRKMYFYFKMNQEEFMEKYHKRSNVESTFAAMKKKLGEGLKSKLYRTQVNELLCKVIAYNITVLITEMHELGIQPAFCTNNPLAAQKIGA